MPLSEIKIAPGINKQVTPTGAQGKWVDCDNVRFRYGYPEKIGGWEQTTTDTLVGVTRATHIWGSFNFMYVYIYEWVSCSNSEQSWTWFNRR